MTLTLNLTLILPFSDYEQLRQNNINRNNAFKKKCILKLHFKRTKTLNLKLLELKREILSGQQKKTLYISLLFQTATLPLNGYNKNLLKLNKTFLLLFSKKQINPLLTGNFNILHCYLSNLQLRISCLYRSDNATIKGIVLEVMFECSTDSYVYKYQDVFSKDTEYISVEELADSAWKEITPLVEVTSAIKKIKLQIPRKLLKQC